MKTQPMRVHKSVLLFALRSEAKDGGGEVLRQCLPDWPGTIREAIIALENNPAEWLDEIQLVYPDKST